MRESQFWKYVKDGMRNKWLEDRIETGSTKAGVPDVFYTMDNMMGWVELKVFTSLPKGENSIVKMKVSPLQAHWLNSRWKRNPGSTWLLARQDVPKNFYLFRGIDVVSRYSGSKFEETCHKKWEKQINFDELAFFLQNEAV